MMRRRRTASSPRHQTSTADRYDRYRRHSKIPANPKSSLLQQIVVVLFFHATVNEKPRQNNITGGVFRANGQNYFWTYSSMGLSFGLSQAALMLALSGRPTLAFFGGIGCMNHLLYSLFISLDLIMLLTVSSAMRLNQGSSLRIMMAMGSTLSTSPTSLKSDGFLAVAMLPARMEPSITKASARPDSSSRKLSEWSLPKISLNSTPAARLFLRSVCTEVVPVVVATVLPLSWETEVMPELAFTAMRTSSTNVVSTKATSF